MLNSINLLGTAHFVANCLLLLLAILICSGCSTCSSYMEVPRSAAESSAEPGYISSWHFPFYSVHLLNEIATFPAFCMGSQSIALAGTVIYLLWRDHSSGGSVRWGIASHRCCLRRDMTTTVRQCHVCALLVDTCNVQCNIC